MSSSAIHECEHTQINSVCMALATFGGTQNEPTVTVCWFVADTQLAFKFTQKAFFKRF